MRVLIAGASGAIGRPLVRALRANQHEVFALTRSPASSSLQETGALPVIADALDADAVKAAVEHIRPDAVINELTSLPRRYTPSEMKAAAERDRRVRMEGNINLLATLHDAGVRRYLLQSSGFWYAPGDGLADESVPLITSASPGVEAGARTYLELEARAAATPGIEFVALRYGSSTDPAPGTRATVTLAIRCANSRFPLLVRGKVSIASCISMMRPRPPLPRSSALREYTTSSMPTRCLSTCGLTEFARAAGAPAPPRISEDEALRTSRPRCSLLRDAAERRFPTRRPERVLQFRPRPLEWT